MKAPVFLFLVFTSLFGPLRPANAGVCEFDKQKEILLDDSTEADVIWTLEETPELDNEYAGEDPLWNAYSAWVRTKTAWSAREIILNHVRVGERLVARLPESDPFRHSVLRSNRNSMLVASGKIGRLRRMNCLESLPLRELLKAVDLRRNGKEFHVSVLRKQSTLKVLLNFSKSTDNSQSGAESELMARLRGQLVSDGWRTASHLHNHPFAFENPYGDIGGILCPSGPDIELYRRGRFPRALITNGIDTVELHEGEIGRFEKEN